MRYLRHIRIFVASAVLIMIFTAFLGLGHKLFLVDIQWIPSFLRTLAVGLGWGSLAFFVLVGVTLLFGRVYCSFLCPLGILQDVIARVARLGRKRNRYHRQPDLGGLHFGVLALLLIPLFFAGSAAAIGLLDPYSLFGRISNSLAVPMLREINNLGAWFVSGTGHYWIIPVKNYWPPIWSLALTSALFLVIVAAVVWNGRVFCNTLCPAGAMMRLLAKFSFLRLRIKDTLCNRCGSCEKACKAGCIDRRTKEIDFSRCVMCFNCVESCQKDGVFFERNPFWALGKKPCPVSPNIPPATTDLADTKPAQAEPDPNRRLFLRSGLLAGAIATPASSLNAQGRHRNRERAHDSDSEAKHFRYSDILPPTIPPGAGNLDHFQSHCTACQLCVNRCPTHVLTPSFLKLGIQGFQQPIFDFTRGYCDYECQRCTEVCPTGALTPLDLATKKLTRIGIAHFFRRHCVVYADHNECGACIEHCPAIAVTGKPFLGDQPNLLLPYVNESLCIGCGICEYVCPVSPSAIRIEGLTTHNRAEAKQSKPLENVPDLSEDFPF